MKVPSAKSALLESRLHDVRRRHALLAGLVLAAFAVSGTASAGAPADAAAIYRTALKMIIEHDRPVRFAIYDQQITSAAITTPRVPRHEPYGQFARSLPGVGEELQNDLVSPSASASRETRLQTFDASASGFPFAGFVDSAALSQLEAGGKDQLLVVGFSKVAYGHHGQEALVYTEHDSSRTKCE